MTRLLAARMLGFVLVFAMLAVLPQTRAQENDPRQTVVSRIDLVDADLSKAASLLTQQTGVRITVEPGFTSFKPVTLSLTNKRLGYVLNVIARASGAALRFENGAYTFGPKTNPDEPPFSIKDVHRIVTLGDSITEAGGQPGGYVWLLDKYLNALYPDQHIQVINAGISGHKSTDMEARFQRDVLDKKPDLVTINVGVNDVWHAFKGFGRGPDYPGGNGPNGVPVSVYRDKLSTMVKAAQAAGIRVVLVSPTLIYERLDSPENARLLGYVQAMQGIADQNHCGFIDLNAPFEEIITAYQRHAGRAANLLTTDGVHMNPAGNRVMAHEILLGIGVTEKELDSVKIGN